MFRLAAHNWMRPEPLEVSCARLQRLGYQAMELMGEPTRFEARETRAILQKYKIDCWGVATIMIKGRDLIHADKKVRTDSIKYVTDCITLSHELGGEIMTIVPSEVGKITPMADPETEWAWAIESLKPIVDHARKQKIRIALEPINRFETNFLMRHDQALCLADALGEDVGVCLDTFHLNIEEKSPCDAIRKTGKRLFDIHLGDNNRYAPGDGAYDWHAVLGALKDVGYTGCLAAEFVIPVDRSPLGKKSSEGNEGATEEELKWLRDHGSDVMSDAEYTRHFEKCINHIRKCEPHD